MARGLDSDSVSDSSVRSGSIRSSVCGLLTGEKDASMLCAACLVVPVAPVFATLSHMLTTYP